MWCLLALLAVLSCDSTSPPVKFGGELPSRQATAFAEDPHLVLLQIDAGVTVSAPTLRKVSSRIDVNATQGLPDASARMTRQPMGQPLAADPVPVPELPSHPLPPAPGKESQTTFTAVMEIDHNMAGDLQALMINIGTCFCLCAGCVLAMSWLRLHFPLTYSHNVISGIAPFTPAETFFGWVRASLDITTKQAQQTAGLDMAMLLQFHEMCVWIMLLIGIPFVTVFCPLHFFKGGDKAQEDRLSKIALGNDQDKFGIWWAVALGTWYVVCITHFVIWNFQKAFVSRRFQWLQDMPEPRSSTVLVTGIPLAYCTDARLKEYFNNMFSDKEAVEAAFIVKHTRPLRLAIDDYEAAKHNLDVAQASWVKDGKDEEKRPRVFKSWAYQDAIEYYTAELKRCDQLVKQERQDVKEKSAAVADRFMVEKSDFASDEEPELDEKGHLIDAGIRQALTRLGSSIEPNTTNGFVTFKSRHHQAMAVRMQFRADDEEFLCMVPPDPADVQYQSFMLDESTMRLYHIIGFAWLAALFLAYMPFVLTISQMTNLHVMAEWNDRAKYVVDNYPAIAEAYDGMMGSIGIEIFMSMLPTVLSAIFNSFWTPNATAYLQVYMQNWYFYFLLIFVLLITGLGNSLYDRMKEMLLDPMGVLDVFFSTMPSTSHFYMNYVVLNTVTQGMVLTRYVPLLKYIGWRALFDQATAREKSEPEDPDYYGIGSRSARFTLMFSICLVFSSISPLILILGLLYFSWTRVIYGYLLVFAESRKADLGGVFWCQQIRHIHLVMWIYCVLMSGVCAARGPVWQCGLLPLTAMALHYAVCIRFGHRFKWEFLPFEANVALSHKLTKLKEQEKKSWRKTVSASTYYEQPELFEG